MDFDRILDLAQDSQLSDEFWKSVKNPLAFLNKELGLTNVQIVALAMLIEAGEPMSWKSMGNYLGCSRLSIMVYSEEIEELVTKRWAIHKGVHEIGGFFEGIALVRGVVTALRHNKTFVPEKIDGLNEQQFVDKLERHVEKNMNDRNAVFNDDEEWMREFAKANPHLPLCHEVVLMVRVLPSRLSMAFILRSMTVTLCARDLETGAIPSFNAVILNISVMRVRPIQNSICSHVRQSQSFFLPIHPVTQSVEG